MVFFQVALVTFTVLPTDVLQRLSGPIVRPSVSIRTELPPHISMAFFRNVRSPLSHPESPVVSKLIPGKKPKAGFIKSERRRRARAR